MKIGRRKLTLLLLVLLGIFCAVSAYVVERRIISKIQQRRHAANICSCTSEQQIFKSEVDTLIEKGWVKEGDILKPNDILSLRNFYTSDTALRRECQEGGIITIKRAGDPPSCSVHGRLYN